MTREQERLQERHQNGMCGGDCSECWKQQEREAERRNYKEAEQEWARANSANTAEAEAIRDFNKPFTASASENVK